MATKTLLTVQQHIIEEQRRHRPHASGEFSWLLSGITLAAKIIGSHVRRAGLEDILGSAHRRKTRGRNRLVQEKSRITFEQRSGLLIDMCRRPVRAAP